MVRETQQVSGGSRYRFGAFFDLPAVRVPPGPKRRTNLGLYAGTDEIFGGHALWAIRALRRIYMNNFPLNASATETDMFHSGDAYTPPPKTAVQTAHGADPGDSTAAKSPVAAAGCCSTGDPRFLPHPTNFVWGSSMQTIPGTFRDKAADPGTRKMTPVMDNFPIAKGRTSIGTSGDRSAAQQWSARNIAPIPGCISVGSCGRNMAEG